MPSWLRFTRRRYGRVEPQVPSNPRVHQARRESAKQLQRRDASDRVSQFRASRIGGLEPGLGDSLRSVARGKGLQVTLVEGGASRPVVFDLRVGLEQVRVERGLRDIGFDDNDSNTTGPQL